MKDKFFSRREFLALGIGGAAFRLVANAGGNKTNYSSTPVLSDWLDKHPRVRDSISWLFLNGNYPELKNYSEWTAEQKNELQKAFEAAWNNKPTNLPDPPPNLLPNTSDVSSETILSPELAWHYFIANIAQSLCLEIGKRVPWSITEYSGDSLILLLHGFALFNWNRELKGYSIKNEAIGSFTPSPPDTILRFLNSIKVVSTENPEPKSSLETSAGESEARISAISKFLDWTRFNLTHFIGRYTTENMKAHWQYSGFPPVSRVLQGTINKAEMPSAVQHWTAGCSGTVGLLNGVLRAINIPVERFIVCGHSLPFFSADNILLTHGDDPYTLFSRPESNKALLPFPSSELFVSQSDFDTWFKAETHSERCKIVGRRPTELAVKYLPHGLVQFYLSDKAKKKSHAEGKVFENLSQIYTLEELEKMRLWERLEEKIKRL